MDRQVIMIPNEIDQAIASAQTLLQSGSRVEASRLLDQVVALEPLNIAAHNLREQHALPGNFSSWMGVNAQLSADDDIFRFFANHPTSKNPVRDYLADGWRTMVELHDILDLYGLTLRQCDGFLEFACGHGRFTRHLSNKLPKGKLHVSDVVPGSVDFLIDSFGVQGFYSTIDPAELVIADKYQIIFVLSLFSHLPASAWGPWFQVLYQALKPGGLLIFSTHGSKCARMEQIDWGSDEYRFYPYSESSALDGQVYGCAYASIEFVRSAITNAIGAQAQTQSLESHFWGNQDAVIVQSK
jgi:SAM-dependent methyltransferase